MRLNFFRSWKLVSRESFPAVQTVHWHKLPYWIFAPVLAALAGGIALIWVHPAQCPVWAIDGALICQILALVLTAMFWGRWQAQLATDPRGPQSPHLDRILRTHWLRTLLINAYAGLLLVAAIAALDG